MHLYAFLGNAFGKNAFSESKNAFLGNAFGRNAFSEPKNAFSPNANWPMTVEYAHSMRSARENNLNFSVNTTAQSVCFEFRVVNFISFGVNFDRFLSFSS